MILQVRLNWMTDVRAVGGDIVLLACWCTCTQVSGILTPEHFELYLYNLASDIPTHAVIYSLPVFFFSKTLGACDGNVEVNITVSIGKVTKGVNVIVFRVARRKE
jgi:hypothetical protein